MFIEFRLIEILHKEISDMSNLDDSIGKLLLDLQKNDPDTFKKLMKRAQEENPELFENVDNDNKEIEEYNQKVDEYNKKVDEE
jgi:hypothetical protein